MDFFELLDAAQPGLQCFDYDHYPRFFQEFETRADGFFSALDAAHFDTLIDELLYRTQERWKAAGFWKRADLMRRDQAALAIFFTPAAARHSDTARAFAALLTDCWNSRFPRNRFHAGDYEKIMQGFDKDFMGIKLRKSKGL